MKKIFLFLAFFLLGISSASAQNTVYLNPDVSFLPASESIGTALPTDGIASNATSRERFCVALGGFYVAHSTGDSSGSGRARYINNQWDFQGSNHTILSEITCFIPAPSTGGGQTNFSGDITTRDYLQLIVYKDGQYFLNQDIFGYLLILILLANLLTRSLIKFAVWTFSAGFYFTSGRKLLGKK